jgi:drug/metabolite transporter (DMT)-like permease
MSNQTSNRYIASRDSATESRNPGLKPEGGRAGGAEARAAEALPRSGFLLLAALTLLWGFNWPIMKIALSEIPPWTFRTFCLIFGGIGVLTVAKTSGLSLAVPREELRPLLLSALLNITGWNLCSAYGLIYMNAGRAAIVAFTMPLWAALMSAVVLRERLTRLRVVGLFFGLLGLGTLMGPEIKALGTAPWGAGFMLGAALSWAAGTVAVKYFRWTLQTGALTGWMLVLGAIPVVTGALVLEPLTAISQVSWQAALATAYVIALPIIFCYWAWFKVVELFPASVASIGTLAIPVVGVFSSALVLSEPIGVYELASLFLVVVALAIVMIGPGLMRQLGRT